MQQSFKNIVVFLIINVPLTVILAITLAIALNAAIPFRAFFRTAYYVPYVTASVAVIAVWRWLFSSDGLVNNLLGPLAPDPSWLINERLAMPSIAFYVTWKQLGFYILLYLAALQNVGKELYEAASVDGAGQWARFRNVTWPGVRPATTLVVVLAIITGSNLFTEPYLMTAGGGPNGASSSPVLIMYQTGIEQGNAGAAAALGVILVIFVGVVGLVARRRQRGELVMSSIDTAAYESDIDLAVHHAAAVAGATQGLAGPAARDRRLRVHVPLLLHVHRLAADGSRHGHRRRGAASRATSPPPTTPISTMPSTCLVRSRTRRSSRPACCVGTIFFGLLAGYAMAVLRFRGRGATFASVLLVQTIPFQLLIIPLYVLLVRNYGLGDTYLGMILPFAIGPAAVFIFRQFFLQLPRELFDAARIDGAGEFTILRRIAVPLARPAILTAALLTFIGPWNEFLWPFLITKKANMQPLAVSLANYLSTLQATVANPFGSVMAGACVLAAPVIGLFIVFQRHFTSSDIGSGVKG